MRKLKINREKRIAKKERELAKKKERELRAEINRALNSKIKKYAKKVEELKEKIHIMGLSSLNSINI